MTILGIETSCDETGAALVKKQDNNNLLLLQNHVASSLVLHAKTGGIIPETAAREQVKYIIPVIQKALETTTWHTIDAIAVTYGPGLIGSLLVGVETAKTLAYIYNKPIIPVNHMHGHIYANWLTTDNELHSPKVEFPAIALVVSGGHTDLLFMENQYGIKVLGGTRDDAAGEAFDKIGRLMNLPYPAGPAIAQLAKKGDSKAFNLPRPLIGSNDFDFSFSGLKTAALRESQKIKHWDNKTMADFCASVQFAIVDVLIKKTIKAAKQTSAKSILLGGGVAANDKLNEELQVKSSELRVKLFVPTKSLCTDNAAMIAAAGFFTKPTQWSSITANPELYY